MTGLDSAQRSLHGNLQKTVIVLPFWVARYRSGTFDEVIETHEIHIPD